MYHSDDQCIWELFLEGAAEDMIKSALTKAHASEDIIKFFQQKNPTTNKILFKPEHVLHLYAWINDGQATQEQLLDYYKSYAAFNMPQKVQDFKAFTDFTKAVNAKNNERIKRQASKSPIDLSTIDNNKIVVDDAVVTILRADNQVDTIKFGQGAKYGFCIARPGGGNLYGNYRLQFASTFYFCYFKGVPESNNKHIAVVDCKKDDKWGLTFADNRTREGITWEEVIEQVPALKPYKQVFKNKPLTPEEKQMHIKMEDFLNYRTKEKFYAFTPDEQVDALHQGMLIPDDLFDSLTPALRNEWVTVGPEMTDSIFAKLTDAEKKRFFAVRRQQVMQRGYYRDEFDKLAADDDPTFHKQLMQRAQAKCDEVEAKIRAQVVDGVFHVTRDNENLLYFGLYNEEAWEGAINPDQLPFVQPDLSDITLVGDSVSINYDHLELTSVPKLPKGRYNLFLIDNNITSLEGLPEGIEELHVPSNNLENFIGLPHSVTEVNAYNNNLASLEGLHEGVKMLYLGNNKLENLTGLPRSVTFLNASENNITNLEGLREGLKILRIDNNNLKNFIGLPRSVTKLYAPNNNLISLEGLHEGLEYVDVDGFSKEDIENAKRGIYTTRMQESTQLSDALRKFLLTCCMMLMFFITGCATIPSVRTSTDRKITQAEQQLNSTARDFIATANNIITQVNSKQQNPELQRAIEIINKSQVLLRGKVDDGSDYHGLDAKELEHRINQAYEKNRDLMERIEHLEAVRDATNDQLAATNIANQAIHRKEFWDRFKWYSGALVLLSSFVMLLLYVPSAAIKNAWSWLSSKIK